VTHAVVRANYAANQSGVTALPFRIVSDTARYLFTTEQHLGVYHSERGTMIPQTLLELIAAGERIDVEFKGEEREPLNDRELVEAVVCLANRPGTEPGWLLVGVEDDGRITGARPRHEANHTDPLRVTALVAGRTRPSLSVRVEMLTVANRPMLVIEVPASATPVGTADGRYLRRAIGGDGRPCCLPYHFHEMQSRQGDRGLLDYSTSPVPGAKWEDLDPLEFERFRRSVRERRGRSDEALLELPPVELAKALGAVEANGLVTAVRALGLLLFGTEEALRRYLPTHEVAFQVLRGTEVEVNDFFRWPLLRVMEEIESRLRARNREQELLVGMLRVGVPDYSPAAYREAVANALIHRDYTQLGAVHIQWHEERIDISNPGGFPDGVRLDNLLVTPPRPRNPLLADAFKRAGVVERTGRGIDTIFYEQLRNGRPAPSYQQSTESSVVVNLPGGQANLALVQLIVEEAHANRPLRLDDLLIVNRLYHDRVVTTRDAATYIQKSESDARARLESLVEAGLIEGRGSKKGRTYHLSAAAYRRLGEKAAYVRQRGFEPLQQQQMVLQYVEKHGRITRSEVAELCRLSPDQAFRLLKRLVDEGFLEQRGETKGTWYEPRA
jgi:ATP-dependent DNA helicase RecG